MTSIVSEFELKCSQLNQNRAKFKIMNNNLPKKSRRRLAVSRRDMGGTPITSKYMPTDRPHFHQETKGTLYKVQRVYILSSKYQSLVHKVNLTQPVGWRTKMIAIIFIFKIIRR